MLHPLLQILIGLLFVVGLMSLLWFVQRRTKNAGIVDVAWSGAIGVLGVFFAVTGAGDLTRRLLAGALLGVWSENAGTLGVITHTDPQLGLLLASLSRSAGRSVAGNMPSWGTCTSVGSLTLEPDSMTWTVVVEGTGESSRIRSEALFWNPGLDCVSHGVREAELESLVRTVAEGRQHP